MSELEKRVKEYIESLGSPPRYDNLLKEVKLIFSDLAETGVLVLGEDKDLTGSTLEIRTSLLFRRFGFKVDKGRQNQEDFLIKYDFATENNEILAVEVKSSRQPNISRDDLRQLDDWVFDLSGEEKARKEGLGGGLDPASIITGGLISSRHRHPNPHKGVMIFNGPLGISFDNRDKTCFNENDREFIKKRNFCIVAFGTLIEYEKVFERDASIAQTLWKRLHTTVGMLQAPV